MSSVKWFKPPFWCLDHFRIPFVHKNVFLYFLQTFMWNKEILVIFILIRPNFNVNGTFQPFQYLRATNFYIKHQAALAGSIS